MHRLALSLFKVTGWLLVVLAAVALLGWIQSGDPDCRLDTGVFAQLRMCDPAIVGQPHSWSFASLVLIIAVLIVGIACLVRARRGGR